MCCFSKEVRHVSATRVFARALEGDRQLLVYEMKLDADGDLAMVLPIPVPVSSPEETVRFVDMSSCKDFFPQLELLFPIEVLRGGFGVPQPAAFQAQARQLVVHDVSDFEASFVPTVKDFDRLDPRFRMPSGVWDALPAYADWGFCVFKLRAPKGSAAPAPDAATAAADETSPGILDRVINLFRPDAPVAPTATREFHPMAFEFPRRDATKLFFPTVHVHDGAVHAEARFDHTLYCQVGKDSRPPPTSWERSETTAGGEGSLLTTRSAMAWLDRDAYAHRLGIHGTAPNRDTWI